MSLQINKWGKQSFDKELAEIVDNREGHGVRKHEKLPTKEEFDESLKRFLESDNVKKPTEHSEATKEYIREKVNAKEEPLSIDAAIRKIQSRAKNAGSKPTVQPLCDLDTAKRFIWESYKTIASEQNFTIKLTPQHKAVIPLLAAYFSGNETTELDPNKGIYLWGPCGTGKSILMKVIQNVLSTFDYPKRFFTKSVPDLFNEVQAAKEINLSRYCGSTYCFDDLGFDGNTLKHYGNVVNPMEIIFTARYPKFQSHGVLTHATSNLPWSSDKGESMSDRFNDRIASRGSEMFNFILLDGEDLRKSS